MTRYPGACPTDQQVLTGTVRLGLDFLERFPPVCDTKGLTHWKPGPWRSAWILRLSLARQLKISAASFHQSMPLMMTVLLLLQVQGFAYLYWTFYSQATQGTQWFGTAPTQKEEITITVHPDYLDVQLDLEISVGGNKPAAFTDALKSGAQGIRGSRRPKRYHPSTPQGSGAVGMGRQGSIRHFHFPCGVGAIPEAEIALFSSFKRGGFSIPKAEFTQRKNLDDLGIRG